MRKSAGASTGPVSRTLWVVTAMSAIANAVAQLTGGVRLRHYPFLPEWVRQALNA